MAEDGISVDFLIIMWVGRCQNHSLVQWDCKLDSDGMVGQTHQGGQHI